MAETPTLSETDLEECFKVAVDLANRSGEKILNVLNSKKDYKTKENAADLVTETDEAVEKFIFTTLKQRFPDHDFIGEESTSSGDSSPVLTDVPTWIVDPVDGTMNFVHGFPHVAVSIALVINKETEIAVIYSIGEQCLYTARKGQGAIRDDVRIKVSETSDISTALVLADLKWSPPGTENVYVENVGNIFKRAHGVRTVGSAVTAGCLVAKGSADAYFHYEIHCWDMAAICLLITEAGGIVKDPSGNQFDMMSHRILCASSEELLNQLVEILIDIPYI